MESKLSQLTAQAARELYDANVAPVFSRTDETHGDFATNIALQLAGNVGKAPREVAESLVVALLQLDSSLRLEVAGPGFINVTLADSALLQMAHDPVDQQSGAILLEYSCPNAFKALHVGHLYQTVLGDSLARVYTRLGWKVYRVTYGGDVGRHVAMSMWAITNFLGGEKPQKLSEIAPEDRSKWLASMYVEGTKAFETNETTKQEILALNKKVYELHTSKDHESDFAKIYWECRGWSYDAFNAFYEEIEVLPFDRSIGESEVFELGTEIVRGNIGPVFEESDGAVILPESKSGLHTRVFINSEGLPTYEAKDLGVITLEAKDMPYNQRIIMTGNEQAEYMKVVFAAMKLVDKALGDKQKSVTHGLVKFADGQKMSSRLGNVTRATDVLEIARKAVKDERQDIALGAVKYTFLKNSIGGDIAFDLEQSVSTEGNSGPYLQYALVRARSILSKVEEQGSLEQRDIFLENDERRLVNWLGRYNEALLACQIDNSLHHLCGYLYELAQEFNRFYEHNRVLGHERSQLRTALVRRYEAILADGLTVLGIPTPEAM